MTSQKSEHKPMVLGLITAAFVSLVLVTVYRAHLFTQRAEKTTPPVGTFLNVNGHAVHYIKDGSGPTLILLHGAGGHLKDFTYDLIPRLSKDYTVIAFDRPGHGYTRQLPATAATLQRQSDLIIAASKQLGITNAYIMGYSYGGALALHMATHQPKFAKGLTLVSSVAMPWPGKIHLNYRLMSKPILGPALMHFATAYIGDDYFRTSYASIFAPVSEPDGYMDHVGVGMSVRHKSFVENARQLNSLRPQIVEQSRYYPTLSIPIELVHGANDTSVPSYIHAEEFVKITPNANLVKIPDMGHGVLQLAPNDVIAAIDRMVQSQELPN